MTEKTELRIAREGHRSSAGSRWLPPGTAVHLGQRAGELTVLEGCAWLTRSDDIEDYIVLPGEHVRLALAHGAVIESVTKGQGVAYCWRPDCAPVADLEPCSRTRRAPRRLAVAALAYGTADVE